MDYRSKNNSESWDWHGVDYRFQKEPDLEISECLWNGVPQNKEDLSYMFDESTPVKSCEDLAYHVAHGGYTNKDVNEYRETFLQVKRPRMLQFGTPAADPLLCSGEMPSVFLKSEEKDASARTAFHEMSEWEHGCYDVSTSCQESLDQSAEGWISECFNESEMGFNPGELNVCGGSDIQIDVSEFCDVQPEYEADLVHPCAAEIPRNVVFKGKKSHIEAPTKLASVTYPFAFIKPSEISGDITLKDINRWIRTPPASKSNPNYEDPSASYHTSAFSGKPVVGKTRIRTEGGKGSITIMRTKG